MNHRFDLACHAAALLLLEQKVVYSPIVHCHPIVVRHDMPRDFGFWMSLNIHMLERSDYLYVLQIEGWRESRGVSAEIEHAGKKGIPICWMLLKSNNEYEVRESLATPGG
jgi:hypothetical protein